MTLHWWMHWFWVTAQLAAILASPLPSTTEQPRIRGNVETRENLTLDTMKIQEQLSSTSIDPRIIIENVTASSPSRQLDEEEQLGVSSRTSFRVAKAIASSYDSSTKTKEETLETATRKVSVASIGETSRRQETILPTRTSPSNMIARERDESNGTGAVLANSPIKRDSRITWVLTTSRTPTDETNNDEKKTNRGDVIRNFSTSGNGQNEEKDLTVLPLRLEGARFKLVVNRTRTISADGFSTTTFNGSEDIEIDQELAEPRLSGTASSILQGGISESTRLSRARNAFTSDFQRDREEDRSSEVDVDDIIVRTDERINSETDTSSSPSVVDITAITGSCFATVVLLSTMASIGFIMYRRKYLNPPQTLNSDKCSNPDSSGYIDDSTIRDNSEEMYSLDNDSFLNSLEAMTIQNYWTDSVKHTKL